MKLFREPHESFAKLKYKNNLCFKAAFVNNGIPDSQSRLSHENTISSLTIRDSSNCDSSLDLSMIDTGFGMNIEDFRPLLTNKLPSQQTIGVNLKASLQMVNKPKNKSIKFRPRVLRPKKVVLNNGRWTEDEHRRFIEAIFKFGNEWKSVEKHILSRSSAQSRSHSQKFFLKLTGYKLPELENKKPCIETLYETSKAMSASERDKLLNKLMAYEYSQQDDHLASKNRHKATLLAHKRSINKTNLFSTRKFKEELDDQEPQTSSCLSQSSLTTLCTNASKEVTYFEDEFSIIFLKTFENQRNRKCSFDDNKHILFLCEMQEQGSFNCTLNLEENPEDDYIQYLQM